MPVQEDMAITEKVMAVQLPPSFKTKLLKKIKSKFPPSLKLCRASKKKLLCMHWIHLTDEEQLKQIISNSQNRPQVIFKHSTRCSISSVALQRLKKAEQPADIDFYFLDLIAYRQLSNRVSEFFKVDHQSPQILVIKDGACIYDESHLSISMNEILDSAHAA